MVDSEAGTFELIKKKYSKGITLKNVANELSNSSNKKAGSYDFQTILALTDLAKQIGVKPEKLPIDIDLLNFKTFDAAVTRYKIVALFADAIKKEIDANPALYSDDA